MLSISSKLSLNSNTQIPIMGLGTYESASGKITQNAVIDALDAGYLHVDTAKVYGNEKDIGKVFQEKKIADEYIFLTTKLWNSDQGYKNTLKAYEKSIALLNVNYLDLFLIHWPVKGKRLDSWKAMEELYEKGKIKAIGVSNFTIKHLTELIENASIIPAINQVEFSPYLFQIDLLNFCRDNKIQLETYSPLTRGQKLNDPKLVEIAHKYSKSPAQILIRWAIQHSLIVIPKSINKSRIIENANIFDFKISNEDMHIMNEFNEGLRTCWDPTKID